MRVDDLVAACDAAAFCRSIRETLRDVSLEEFLHTPLIQKAVSYDFGIIASCFQNMKGLARKSGTSDFDGIDQELWDRVREMRNEIAHQYVKIVKPDFYEFCKKEIPMFEVEIRACVARSGLDCIEADAT